MQRKTGSQRKSDSWLWPLVRMIVQWEESWRSVRKGAGGRSGDDGGTPTARPFVDVRDLQGNGNKRSQDHLPNDQHFCGKIFLKHWWKTSTLCIVF